MVKIIPAILTSNEDDLWDQVRKVEGLVETIQIDIVDGIYALEKTIDPEVLIHGGKRAEMFDLHLMVKEPESWIERLEGAKWNRVIGQVELMKNRDDFIADVQALGWGVGLGVDIETNSEVVRDVINEVDCILLMGVRAGKQGQVFDERVLMKIKQLREWSKRVDIIIDGGLSEEIIRKCVAAEWEEEIREEALTKSFGGMEFVVGSHLWREKNVIEELEHLRNLELH